MVKVEVGITISAPIEKVFSYVADPTHKMDFIPSMTEIRGITGQGVGQKVGLDLQDDGRASQRGSRGHRIYSKQTVCR